MAYFLIYTITLFDTLSFTFGLTSVVLFIIYGHIMLKDFGYLTDEQIPVPLFFKAEKKFQEQVKACIQLKEREKLMTLDKIFSFFKKFNFLE